jgi:hypothetical protein
MKDHPDVPRLDPIKPNILRNNRWKCDHGWDIDLDDASSNYEIENNLCLKGGIKNREGYYRIDKNNIIVNNSLNCHVWFPDSGDVFTHNIIWAPYLPTGMCPKPWEKEMDYNFVQKNGDSGTQPAINLQNQSGRDEHSLVGDAMFKDPAHGDYRVKDGSPALALGFVNFPMDRFGVEKPELKALACTPVLPGEENGPKVTDQRDGTVTSWRGASVRNVLDQGEMSVYGLPGVTGVLVLYVSPDSPLAKFGLRKDDVILEVDGQNIVEWADLLAAEKRLGTWFQLTVSRGPNQLLLPQ